MQRLRFFDDLSFMDGTFWINIKIQPNNCWIWMASKTTRGYGTIKLKGKNVKVHILSYIFYKGKIPEGLVLDHLCKNTSCVNPDHLEAVTQKENILRGNSPSAIHARKTHCIRGHEFKGENFYIDSKGQRVCRKCNHERYLKFRSNNR